MTKRLALLASVPLIAVLVLLAGLYTLSSAAGAPTKVLMESSIVALDSVQDNTLYEESGLQSSGQGEYFFAGRTAALASDNGYLRRGLLKFDIANFLPPDALIISATLRLYVSKRPILWKPEQFSIHRLLARWGEGASDAGDPGGEGAPAEEGDATWSFAFYSITPTNLISWTNPGGDFVPAASASTLVGEMGKFYEWGPSEGMITDINHWLRYPENNHGWLLKGNELENQTARRFDTRENTMEDNRPVLYVEYVIIQSRNYLPLIASD
jgi:hypothetical protein